MNAGLFLIDTSGLFRILQGELRKTWSDQLAAGVIATRPIVELEFLYSARSLADRLESSGSCMTCLAGCRCTRAHSSEQPVKLVTDV
jgi:predicted nucleic acid-binding protein